MSSLLSYRLRWLVFYSILPATLSADPQAQWATFHSVTLSLSHDLSYLHKASKRQTGSQPTWVAQSRHAPHTGSAWTPNLHRPAVTSGVVWLTGSATEPRPGVPLSQRGNLTWPAPTNVHLESRLSAADIPSRVHVSETVFLIRGTAVPSFLPSVSHTPLTSRLKC